MEMHCMKYFVLVVENWLTQVRRKALGWYDLKE